MKDLISALLNDLVLVAMLSCLALTAGNATPKTTTSQSPTTLEERALAEIADVRYVVACELILMYLGHEDEAMWYDALLVEAYGVEQADKILELMEPLITQNLKGREPAKNELAAMHCRAVHAQLQDKLP